MPVEIDPPDDLRALIERTHKKNPKRKDVVALRNKLRDTELWTLAGQVAEHAVSKIIDQASGDSALLKESMKEAVRRQRAELTEEQDGPLERLLIEQIAVAWLALYTTQYSFDGMLTAGTTFSNLDFWQRRLNGAHRRFIRACEALARLRKLARRGPVQVNVVAEGGTFQQVNMGAKRANLV